MSLFLAGPVFDLCSLYLAIGNLSSKTVKRHHIILPVNTRALYAESDAQIDTGPAGVWLATVTAAGVAWDGQDFLQGTLSFQ